MSTMIFANSAILDASTHEEMGFHEGWSQCADQLATLVTGLGKAHEHDEREQSNDD